MDIRGSATGPACGDGPGSPAAVAGVDVCPGGSGALRGSAACRNTGSVREDRLLERIKRTYEAVFADTDWLIEDAIEEARNSRSPTAASFSAFARRSAGSTRRSVR